MGGRTEDKSRIKEKLRSLTKEYSKKIDYLDIRIGASNGTLIEISQKKLDEISRPNFFGGSVRAYSRGGWGFSSFNDPKNIEQSVKDAIDFAKTVSGEKFSLSEASLVEDRVKVKESERDFVDISLDEKIKILKSYDKLAWAKGKKVVNVNIVYTDSLAWKIFASSNGSLIEQEKGIVYSNLLVMAKSGNVIQRYLTRLSDSNFKEILGKEKLVEDSVIIAEKIAQAPPVKSGKYLVVVDPKLSGLLAHEAFGHLSEADNVYENPQLASVMKLGKKFGSELVTIIDDPTMPALSGTYKYDDEGVLSQKTILLDKGVLKGRLHSLETAGKMNEKPNGHARAGSIRTQPLVRMANTYIAPGKSAFDEMIARIKEGLYCVNWQGGMTDHERFTFTAGYGVEIKNGKLGRVVRDVKLTGNLFETLKNIDMVGSNLVFEGGNCGKKDQSVPVTTGGPHIRIQDTMVIGV